MGIVSRDYPYFGREYVKLVPNLTRLVVMNLCHMVDRSSRLTKCSVQALATANVDCKIMISNFYNIPFIKEYNTDNTNHILHHGVKGEMLLYDWDIIDTTKNAEGKDLKGMWFPCSSLPDMTFVANTPYFKQYEYNEVARFMLIQLKASQPAEVPLVLDTNGVSTARVAFTFNITFN